MFPVFVLLSFFPHRLGGVIDARASKAPHRFDRIASRNGSKYEYPVRANVASPPSSGGDSFASLFISSDTRRSPVSSQLSPSQPSPLQSSSSFDRKRSASASKSEEECHARDSSSSDWLLPDSILVNELYLLTRQFSNASIKRGERDLARGDADAGKFLLAPCLLFVFRRIRGGFFDLSRPARVNLFPLSSKTTHITKKTEIEGIAPRCDESNVWLRCIGFLASSVRWTTIQCSEFFSSARGF